MLLLLLLIVACFDGQSQPYLYVYHVAFFIIPWCYFIGFLISLVLIKITANKILGIAVLFVFAVAALLFYMVFNIKLKNETEESIVSKMNKKLINLSKNDIDVLNKYKKIYKWDITILLAITIIAGKFIAHYKIIFIFFVFVIYMFCILSCFKIFKIRYKTNIKRILNICLSSIIFWCLAVFAILINFNLVPHYSESVDLSDVSIIVAFGLIPFAKQTAFGYFAQEHFKIREEINCL